MQNGPTVLETESILDDADFRPGMHFTNRDGSSMDLTASGRDPVCELSAVGSATTYTRRKSVTGEAVYLTTGVDGDVEFVFTKAFLQGLTITAPTVFDIAYFVEETGSVRRKVASGQVRISPRVT